MDCVNHTGVNATAYCQNCGKALCASCVRNAAGGQVLCEPCWTAWHTYQQPFVGVPSGSPSPTAAAVLGLIPGVGAMYNGQFMKGLLHVVIFAVLVSAAHVYGVFGILIAAWILYQSFEAYHTARARRDGQPLPDPLGLNEVGSWLGAGRQQYPGHPGAAPGAGDPNQPAGPGPSGAGYQPPYQTPYQAPFQGAPYQTPYQPYTPPAAGFTDPGAQPVPPIPPVPPVGWRRREPIGAIVLIGLGVLFLLGQLDIFSGRLVEFTWPMLLIGLGVWMIVRRLEETKGGSK
jgi:hypothetical protein